MTTGILIPIRQGSRRLPLKHLHLIGEKTTLLELLVERMRKVKGAVVHLCIPNADFLYQDWATYLGVKFSVGDEEDVFHLLTY